jgi:hypothetical protein
MKIYWDTDVRAPCCPGQIVSEDGQSVLVQTDWDYPSVAGTFGWNIGEVQVQNAGYYGVACDHSGTDGTIDCPDCGVKAGAFIGAAYDYLIENDGASVEDPGYFSGD